MIARLDPGDRAMSKAKRLPCAFATVAGCPYDRRTGHREQARVLAYTGMLSPLERLAVAHFRASLEARFGGRLAGLTLFGSRARGEGDEDSDVDLYVVIRDVTRAERREVQDLAFDVELEHRVRIAPLVRGAGFDALGAGLAAELRRDGVSL